jgi:hypothetical protein
MDSRVGKVIADFCGGGNGGGKGSGNGGGADVKAPLLEVRAFVCVEMTHFLCLLCVSGLHQGMRRIHVVFL